MTTRLRNAGSEAACRRAATRASVREFRDEAIDVAGGLQDRPVESEVRIHGPVDVILSVGLFVVGLVLRQQLQLLLRAPLSREPCGSDLDDPTQLQHLLLDVMVIASQQCDVGDETRVVPQPVGRRCPCRGRL